MTSAPAHRVQPTSPPRERPNVVLLAEAEAMSTVRHLCEVGQQARLLRRPRRSRRQLRRPGLRPGRHVQHGASGDHGLTTAPSQYALLENARRAPPAAESRDTVFGRHGRVFAPFTKVAAANPFSAAPVERSVEELITVTESNRMISDPYPRLLVARDQVNPGAAALLMSVGIGSAQHGVPEIIGFSCMAHADLEEQKSAGSARPRRLAVRGHGGARSAVRRRARHRRRRDFDLYSCFPVPVFNICDGVGSRPTIPAG